MRNLGDSLVNNTPYSSFYHGGNIHHFDFVRRMINTYVLKYLYKEANLIPILLVVPSVNRNERKTNNKYQQLDSNAYYLIIEIKLCYRKG